MDNQQPNHLASPLDSLEKHTKQHPALRWLVIYGLFFLIVKFVYVFVFPLLTASSLIQAENMHAVYQKFSLLVSLGHIAIAAAIVVLINHTLCKILFAGIIFLELCSIVSMLFI